MLKILIVGATSEIAHETARLFAADHAELFLVGRNPDKLEAVRDDLLVHGAARVETYALDLANLAQHQAMLDTAIETLGGLDAVLIAHGTLTNQQSAQQSVEETLRELNINFLSVVSLLTPLANYFETQKRGSIAVISSVAGDRGRMSNYIYGTAKAGVSTFLQGLRARLQKSGVSVLTVKPGFVDTPMTAHLKKNPLYASPAKVGAAIYKAMKQQRDVLYTPWFWRYIMLVINNIPEFIFKRTRL
ncbi:MAG: short-chain dehydrogenase [Phototrophicales bacterium]|nr:MAG: short-chain dehydrogenase [Phototrophicales bacterium]